MSTTQDRADEAARDLINAATKLAGPGSYELVVILRGHITPSAPKSSDVFYTYEWFVRDADPPARNGQPENHSAPAGDAQEDGNHGAGQ